MPKIIQLSPHIANLIAAGEVVERPASVAKELLENAVDAGASQVTVEIRDGGMTFIRITDNGCGMSPEDARTAFLRHATSKLRSAEDLAEHYAIIGMATVIDNYPLYADATNEASADGYPVKSADTLAFIVKNFVNEILPKSVSDTPS